MKKWFFWMLLGSLILFGGAFGFYGFKQQMIAQYLSNMPKPVIAVTAIEVKPSDWTPEIDAIGFIEPKQGVMLSSQVSGVVSEILVNSGQSVDSGAILLRFDAAKERADLRSAESRLVSVSTELERLKKLARERLASQEQVDSANAQYLSLLAQIDSLKATLSLREIRAPFKGITGIVQVQQGEYLQPGADIIRLENIDVMRIRFIIGEKDYARVSVGMPIKVRVSAFADREFEGSISAIEPVIDYQSGVVQLQASIPNSEKLLRAGMYAEVSIQQDLMTGQLVIPQSAINFTLYGETVYLLEDAEVESTVSDGESAAAAVKVARLQVVTAAERKDSVARIASGLNAADLIVTSGQLKLSNGTQVKIIEDDTLAAPASLPLR